MPEKIEKTSKTRALESEYVAPTIGAIGTDKTLFASDSSATINTLYETVKHSPEVLSCIQAIVEDIMADGWRFDSLTKKGKSKHALEKALEFQEKSKFYKILTNALIDLLITGNAYILKLSVSEDKIKSIVRNLTKRIAKTLNVKIDKKIVNEVLVQDLTKPKDLQLIKSSTVKINFDETGKIVSYEQNVNGKKLVFDAKDVIHLSLMNIGGQPYGFTPLETLLSDIATLIYAKEYAGKYFENDGIPTFVFKLPKEHPNSPNYEKLKQELKELKKQKNKWKSLVVTGEIDVEQIQKFNKDMEFTKLIQHFTQIILMAYGVPAHRVNLTIDVRQIGGAVNRAYEGYYKKISFCQKAIQEVLNRELWVPYFKVRMRFKEGYKIDEMREAQIIQILSQTGTITIEEAREMIGLDPEKPEGQELTSIGDDKRINFNEDKRREINQEERNDRTDNKLKSIVDDSLLVSYDDFVEIVLSKHKSFENAKILYVELMDKFILFFDDGSWKYKTEIEKRSLKRVTGYETIDEFRFEKLKNAIRIFM